MMGRNCKPNTIQEYYIGVGMMILLVLVISAPIVALAYKIVHGVI